MHCQSTCLVRLLAHLQLLINLLMYLTIYKKENKYSQINSKKTPVVNHKKLVVNHQCDAIYI